MGAVGGSGLGRRGMITGQCWRAVVEDGDEELWFVGRDIQVTFSLGPFLLP
jgi:hypothetical protein